MRLGSTDPTKPDWAEVVGVMSDFKGAAEFYNPEGAGPKFLRSWAQNNDRFIGFHIRTSGDAGAIKESVRKAMGQLAPDLAISQLSTVHELMASEVSYFTFLRRLLVQISALGLLLSAIGIYGVVANLASERTKEIGIRLALGAQPGSIVWLFVRNGIVLIAIGLAFGIGTSFVLVRILSRELPIVPGGDPWVVGCVAILLAVTALAGTWVPSLRTARVDPIAALRSD
jgi:putative ABC transport system permease protein